MLLTNKQTNQQKNKQTNATENITSYAKEVIKASVTTNPLLQVTPVSLFMIQ